MRVRIDETRRDYEARGIDDARGGQVRLARIANESNSITANTNICGAWFVARTIDEFAVKNKEIELLIAKNLSLRSKAKRAERNYREKE